MKARATDPQPGLKAQWSSECPRCGEFIARGVDRIVFSKGRPIHVACANGWNE